MFGGHEYAVLALAVLPDGMLASGSIDCTVGIWDNGAPFKVLCGRTGPVRTLVVLPNKKLASGSDDAIVRVWNIDSGACEFELQGHTKRVMTIAALPDGTLMSGSLDMTVRIWDIDTGSCLSTLVQPSVASALMVVQNGPMMIAHGNKIDVF
jgi:WD40 repeat protein